MQGLNGEEGPIGLPVSHLLISWRVLITCLSDAAAVAASLVRICFIVLVAWHLPASQIKRVSLQSSETVAN